MERVQGIKNSVRRSKTKQKKQNKTHSDEEGWGVKELTDAGGLGAGPGEVWQAEAGGGALQ